MSDHAFLSEFINEPLYLIKDESVRVEEKETSVQLEIAEPTAYPPAEAAAPAVVEEPKAKVELKPVPTSGQNLKGCIILVNWQDGEVAEEKELLLKIMSSVKRTEQDVLISQASGTSKEQIEALLAEQNHKQVLDFGTGKLPKLSKSDFYQITAEGPKKYLKAHPLAEISTDVDKKKALWKGLKEMFL